MEGRQNVWSPWYSMLKDKPRKVECKITQKVLIDPKITTLEPFNRFYCLRD